MQARAGACLLVLDDDPVVVAELPVLGPAITVVQLCSDRLEASEGVA
jgi:hypothetical protein